jgi:cell division protein FtsB
MGFIKNIRGKTWFKFISNTYVLILIFFLVWMFFFDSNSYLIHKELDEDIEALEQNKEFYQSEIQKDSKFIEKLSDSFELEKFAREKYYLKKENEDIYIIEVEDSLKNDEE